jgi:hypothetical protein
VYFLLAFFLLLFYYFHELKGRLKGQKHTQGRALYVVGVSKRGRRLKNNATYDEIISTRHDGNN